MKILISHIPNTYNYGSMMMAENVITYLNKNIKKEQVEYYTDCRTDGDITRLKQATNYDKIYKDDIICKKSKSKLDKIKNILFAGSYNKKASKYYDLIIVLGGDDFSEFYMNNWIQKILVTKEILDMKKLNKKNNVILLGQTIGPYTGIRKKIARKVFSKIKLYTRDDINLKSMKEEYNIDAISSRDLALLDLARQNEYIKKKTEIFEKYQITEENYIVVVGTQLISKYCSDTKTFVNQFINTIKMLKEKYPEKKIVWLSHVTTEPTRYSDNYLLELINEENNFANENMVVIKERILPIEARVILGFDYFTITCRMHAAVSTFQMGKPAICLSYSPKYKGVIADGLSMPELVIEAKGDELWKNDIIKLVEEKIEYIEKNRKKLIEDIHNNVNSCKQRASETLEDISKELVRRNRIESK